MIEIWGITDKGAVRSQNQDSYYIQSAREGCPAVAIVCDGMGGARAGNVASELAVSAAAEFLEGLDGARMAAAPDKCLSRAAGLANNAVYDRAIHDPDCYGMGTTMVSALIWENRAMVLNIGDSRAYRIGNDGILKVTRDHSLVEDMVHRGELTAEEARTHPQKHLITRALGSEPVARVDLYDLELGQGDLLLLCSDGLSNTLTDVELYEQVMAGGSPEECCRRLLEEALGRGATDNVTAVLVRMA